MSRVEEEKRNANDEVRLLLDEALCKEDYPVLDNNEYVELQEYDRTLKTVFLWVNELFTDDEWDFLQDFMKENFHKRTVVSIIKSDHHFGLE